MAGTGIGRFAAAVVVADVVLAVGAELVDVCGAAALAAGRDAGEAFPAPRGCHSRNPQPHSMTDREMVSATHLPMLVECFTRAVP